MIMTGQGSLAGGGVPGDDQCAQPVDAILLYLYGDMMVGIFCQ